MLKLVGTDGKRLYSWSLEPGVYIVGRKSGSDIHVPHKTVSRDHARLEIGQDDDSCSLIDLESHNGTFVNGKRVSAPIPVKPNDLIMFGHTEFRLTQGDDNSTAPISTTRTRLSDIDPENSIFLSIDEALKPLPTKAADIPELLPTLFEMAKMLVLPEPKEIMLKKSLSLISKIIPAERLAILTVSEDRQEVITEAMYLPGGKDPGTFTLSQTIVNEIMTNKNSILIGNPQDDPRFAEQKSIIMSRIKAAIAVPLFDEGRVLGILYTDTTNPVHSYNDEQMRILATFGNIIASRLLNYELLTERQEKHLIEAELRRASLIQKNLLVTKPPELPGFELCAFQEQSYSVGGDLYDIERLSDGRLLFMVADVSGKGLGAALLMSNILASFRILYESEDFVLKQVVKRVSLQMHRYSASGDFATLFIGIVDPDKNQIKFVNAGHNPPLLVRNAGKVEYLETSGLMIGAFDFADWTEGVVQLEKDDLLFVFSDGVTEAQREEIQYGDERMEQLVVKARMKHPREIVDYLMDDINDFMGDAPRSDDITIFLIKRN